MDAARHVNIHSDGEIAGSQFSGDAFSDPDELIGFMGAILPDTISYDQSGRAELTLDIKNPNNLPIGYTGVKSMDELSQTEGVTLIKSMRTPGGDPDVVDGVQGAWYPETSRDPESGRYIEVKNPDGSLKNPHAKFEQEVTIAKVTNPTAMETSKVTLVIQKDQEGVPGLLTIFPGENAPAIPALVDTEAYKANTLNGFGSEYWANHAFIQAV